MSHLDGSLLSAVRFFRSKSAHNSDLLLSAVHYKVTFGVLLTCGILTGITSWYSPIDCMKSDNNMMDLSFLRQLCYSQAIFIVDGPSTEEQIFPGVHNVHSDSRNRLVYIRYYQWVTLCLIMQAACFQMPRVLWKITEGGRVRRFVNRLNALEMVPDNELNPGIRQLSLRFIVRPLRDHNRYIYWFIVSQSLYVVNAIAQIGVTQSFLNNQFISLMPKWLMGQPVLDKTFPKLVKCAIRTYGPGGDAQKTNVLCLLAMNVLIEKIYLLVWVVLTIALVSSVLQVIYVSMWMTSERVRSASLLNEESIKQMDLHKGEWLFLKFVRDSLDNSMIFTEFVKAIAYAHQPVTAV